MLIVVILSCKIRLLLIFSVLHFNIFPILYYKVEVCKSEE